MSINSKDAGGEGRAEEYIRKFAEKQMAQCNTEADNG